MVQSQCRSTNRNPSRAGWRSVAVALAATLLAPAVARADTATISVVSDQYLRFGSFVVPSAGARTVSASGAVTTSGLLPVGNDPIGPAQFTVTYDRGFDSTRQIAIQVQVVMPGAQAMALAPVTLLLATPARAGGLVADANGESRAEVVAPLTVTRDADLDFGSIFATTQPGTVTVSAGGAASYAGGAASACLGGACAGPHPAQFVVQGEPGRAYAIAVPEAITATGTATDSTGATPPPLTVASLSVHSTSRPAAGPAGQLDAQGSDRFEIGGTLQVPAGLAAAHYRATVAVMVTYG